MGGETLFNCVPRRGEGIEEERLLDEGLLYCSRREMAYSLNPSAMAIWEACGSGATVGEIIDLLMARFECPEEELRQDVIATVHQLMELGLIEASEAGVASQ